MPQYKNNSKVRKVIGNECLEPNSIFESLIYHDIEGVPGIELIRDIPFYSPILVSKKIIGPEAVLEIPKYDYSGKYVHRYAIHFYVEKGEPIICFNGLENQAPLKLYSGAKWNIKCVQRLINKIYVYTDSTKEKKDLKLWIIIEKLN
jgi:hypothetical protein